MLKESRAKKVLGREFLQQTIEVWQPFSSDPLLGFDAEAIVRNVVSFFDLLASWERAELRERYGSQLEN